MAANDNLSEQFANYGAYLKAKNIKLYHGTQEPFSKRARKVHPMPSDGVVGGYEKGWRIAHATTDIEEARLYGPHIYEVDPDEHTEEGYGSTAVFSEKGFKIIRKVQ